MARFTGLLGMAVLVGLAYLFSTSRKSIKLKTVLWGLGLQLAFGIFVLNFGLGRRIFQFLGDVVNKLLSFAFVGSQFVFGGLGMAHSSFGFIFAFQVLPTIIFIAAVFAFLYHVGVMQVFIRAFAWVMTRVMGASGAESLDIAASIFMGQTEAPLTIRPFLNSLTKSELMCVMTCGMAHVSGGIMAAYIASGVEAKHLLTAVIMTAPGTLLMAKMLVPETEQPLTAGKVQMPAMIPPETCAIPQVITHMSSDFVRLFRNGRMVSGASVCPMKMLAAISRDSAPLAPITRVITHANARMKTCITPM